MPALLKIINPIKDAMVASLQSNASAIGIRTVAKDLCLDNLANEIDKMVATFPAAVVVYYGRVSTVAGTVANLVLTFAVVIATRSVQAPNASDPIAADLLDPVFNLFQGENLYPSLQRTWFNLTAETLQHKDKTMTIYQQLYETTVSVSFRDAAKTS